MTAAVVDASAAIAWLVSSQATVASTAFIKVLGSFELEAPFIFEWEVQNTLLRTLRGRGERFYSTLLADFVALDVALWAPMTVDAVMPLARDAKLSLFDASYLKVAMDVGADLISRRSRPPRRRA